MLLVPSGGNNFGVTNPSFGTTRPSGTSIGTSVTPAAGSYGSYVQLFSALSVPAYGILININANNTNATARASVIDIGIDEAGGTSYTARITGILCGSAAAPLNVGLRYYFPLLIPAGASVGVRANSSVATAFPVNATIFQYPDNLTTKRVGSFVETLGVSGNVGTSLTPGTTAEGSWTSIGTTTNKCWSWQIGFQVATADTAWNAAVIYLDLAVGDATNKDIIIKDQPFYTTTAETIFNIPALIGIERDVPAGSTIYLRAQSSAALDTYTAAAYGLGG